VLDSGSNHTANTSGWNTSFSTSTFHSSYHPLPEIQDFIFDLADEHPDLIEVVSIGRTSEQREMAVLKISNKTLAPGGEDAASTRQKSAVVILGAQHAREVRFPRGHPARVQ